MVIGNGTMNIKETKLMKFNINYQIIEKSKPHQP
jgi:hypothetical protein